METLEKHPKAVCHVKFRSSKRAVEYLGRRALQYCAEAKKYGLVTTDWPTYYRDRYVAYAIKRAGTLYLVYCEMDDDAFRGEDGYFDCEALFYLEDLLDNECALVCNPRPSWKRSVRTVNS